MSSALGVMGDLVSRATLERLASGEQEGSWPEYAAPQNVEESNGKVFQLFGLRRCVDETLEEYKMASSRRQCVSIPLGERVVQELAMTEYTPNCMATQVMSTGHCPTGHVAHQSIVG